MSGEIDAFSMSPSQGEGKKGVTLFVTVQHPHLTSPIEWEEVFFPAPGGRG
ncbi:MAG: hypothetical protein HUU08_14935 [Candidatus Brocadia sp.]|nr:hypothetical protein [Candidatus Brocadia sp.]